MVEGREEMVEMQEIHFLQRQAKQFLPFICPNSLKNHRMGRGSGGGAKIGVVGGIHKCIFGFSHTFANSPNPIPPHLRLLHVFFSFRSACACNLFFNDFVIELKVLF